MIKFYKHINQEARGEVQEVKVEKVEWEVKEALLEIYSLISKIVLKNRLMETMELTENQA